VRPKPSSRRLPIVGAAVTVVLISIGMLPRQSWCITGLSASRLESTPARESLGDALKRKARAVAPGLLQKPPTLAGGSSPDGEAKPPKATCGPQQGSTSASATSRPRSPQTAVERRPWFPTPKDWRIPTASEHA
jgi:hypothetical protein